MHFNGCILIQSEGFSQLIFEAQRINENSQSCMDHIFTNISTSCSSGSLAVEIADHIPVFTILYDPKFSPFPDYFEFRDFRSFEDENFKLDLRRESWELFVQDITTRLRSFPTLPPGLLN